tara:strand:+ start:720 stop:962 length:243 start_codon:yes stop_codon:yes gene_type:complete
MLDPSFRPMPRNTFSREHFMSTGPRIDPIRMLIFIGILVVLNLSFAGAGVHEHISIIGSVVLTLVITVIMYFIYSLKRRS